MIPPRISIIIPCYNAEKSLSDCLDGIIAQEYPDKEIVIVDGDSTDGSQETIRAYANRYSFIRWIAEKDRGIYDAMNKGVKMATGEWLFFMGADDKFYKDDVLSGIFSEDHSRNVSVIYGNVEFLYSKLIYDGPYNLHKILFVSNICHQAMFYRKSVFETVGLYDIECKIYADRDFNIRCFLDKTIQLKYIDRIIAVYNEQDGVSASGKTDSIFREKQGRYIKEYDERPLRSLFLKMRLLKTGFKKLIRKPNA